MRQSVSDKTRKSRKRKTDSRKVGIGIKTKSLNSEQSTLLKLEKENSRLLDELRLSRMRFFGLLDACTLLNATLNLDKLLDLIMRIAKEVMYAEASSLMLLDEEKQELKFEVAHGEKGEQVKVIRLKMGEGIAGWVAQTGETLLIPDVSKDPRFYKKADEQTKFTTRCMICAPLKTKEKIIGVVEVINKRDDQIFNEEDVELIEAFANQAAVALENAILYDQLSREKRRIETIVNSMTDGVIVTDNNFQPELLNPAARQIFNLDQEDSIIEGDYKLCILLDQLAKLKKDAIFDICLMKPEGLILSNNVTIMKNEKNINTGSIMVMRNITEIKERERSKSEFLALVAHRLYEPLVKYRDKLTKFGHCYTESLPDEQKEFIKKTARFIDLLYNLVVKLLYFSELEAGPLRIERYRVDLNEMTGKVFERVEPMAQERNISLTNKLPPKGPVISLDEERIHQVMYNLLVNTINFSDEGKTVHVQLEDDVDYVRFSVTGEGDKFPLQKFSTISKKVSAEKDLLIDGESEIGRSNLELAFIKHIIDAHGGKIAAEQKDGNTVYSFSIPKIFF